MKKLTADVARREFRKLQAWEGEGVLTLKEEVYLQALEIALPVLEQQERGEGEWIEWGGGSRPIKYLDGVEIRLRSGNLRCGNAGFWSWQHSGSIADIIAYRIIPEQATNQNGEQ